MKAFDDMISSCKHIGSGVELIFIHNLEYNLNTYKDILVVEIPSIKKGLAYLLDKKHYDDMFVSNKWIDRVHKDKKDSDLKKIEDDIWK